MLKNDFNRHGKASECSRFRGVPSKWESWGERPWQDSVAAQIWAPVLSLCFKSLHFKLQWEE